MPTVNRNNGNTTLSSQFSVFLKPFSLNWDWCFLETFVSQLTFSSPEIIFETLNTKNQKAYPFLKMVASNQQEEGKILNHLFLVQIKNMILICSSSPDSKIKHNYND